MKYIAYILVGLVGFWAGVVHELARRPMQPVYIVKADPPMPKNENCVEQARACYARKRSTATKPL